MRKSSLPIDSPCGMPAACTICVCHYPNYRFMWCTCWCRLFNRFADAASPRGSPASPASPEDRRHADPADLPLWQLVRTPETLAAAAQRRAMPPASGVRSSLLQRSMSPGAILLQSSFMRAIRTLLERAACPCGACCLTVQVHANRAPVSGHLSPAHRTAHVCNCACRQRPHHHRR